MEAAAYFNPGVKAVIVAAVMPGKVDFFEALKQKTLARGLGDRVHFLAPVDPNYLVTYATGADLGIIPRPNTSLNIYYSMPNKMFEMVMSRLPVAASNLYDIRSLIEEHGIGMIFDETDPEDMARVVHRMLEADNYAELKANIEKAASELCWEQEAIKYTSVYEKIRGHRKMKDTQ